MAIGACVVRILLASTKYEHFMVASFSKYENKYLTTSRNKVAGCSVTHVTFICSGVAGTLKKTQWKRVLEELIGAGEEVPCVNTLLKGIHIPVLV